MRFQLKSLGPVATLLLVVLLAPTVLAWDGHDVITYEALKDLKALTAYDSIEITPYSYGEYDQSSYNPDFMIEYKLGGFGERVSALEILATYASEPDWDLDTDLELDPKQALTGGSQGWRHQRYTLWGGLISLGEAPQRAQHFYDLALIAYEKGDLYWAFRFLARSIHYLQDLGQPLHALPLPVSDFIFRHRFNIKAADAVATNVHYSIEEYYDYHLRKGSPSLLRALTGPEVAQINDIVNYAEGENMKARKQAVRMYRLILAIWPELNTAEDVRIPESDYDCTEPQEELNELWKLVQSRLEATAASTRGLVIKFLNHSYFMGNRAKSLSN
ncbi:MAG: hypothetical protein H0Z38_03395 [Firmicutes bacterium]|nr:hypothetical protein [Bacillota bacterium]